MPKIQARPVPESQQPFVVQLIRDFRAALSYVSFYSSDSTFVVQAVQKLYKDFQRLTQEVDPLVFHIQNGKLLVNDRDINEFAELMKVFQDKHLPGLKVSAGVELAELTAWLRQATLPTAKKEEAVPSLHFQNLSNGDWVEILAEEKTTPSLEDLEVSAMSTSPSREAAPAPVAAATQPVPAIALDVPSNASEEALLSFVAEAWQHAQLQKKSLGSNPESAELSKSFDKLFDRLLERMEKSSPHFRNIYQWFHAPSGELMETEIVAGMFPLMETAVRNGWTAILFDPTTEGLVGECLTYWGANGHHDLVEKTVNGLAEGLAGDPLERQLALNHLMDARPWVGNPELLEMVLGRLVTMLSNETSPSQYQSALLLAWDLMGPAMEKGKEQPVLTLLSTLHFHADEPIESFPERARIARHWLFEKSTPELIRKLTGLAYQAGLLKHYPLLGEMAAPVLLQNFFNAQATDRPAYLQLFKEMKEATLTVLTETLAEAQTEEDLAKIIPILRVCGVDAGLSLLLCSWVAKGSRELKLNLIGMIEEMGDPAGGPALRMALFDDSEEIAALAARVVGKIHFAPALPVLLKAAKIREERYGKNETYLVSVCQALGDLGKEESLPFLLDIARKKPLLRGKTLSLAVRLEAIRAITKINKPEAWHFVESLMEEKNPALQEALDRFIHERTGHLS